MTFLYGIAHIRNIFLEKSYRKCGGETIPRLFPKNQDWIDIWINSLKFYSVCIVCQVEDYWNILKLNYRSLAFTVYEAFLKTKMCFGTSFPASFSKRFLKKSIFIIMFYNLIKFNCLVVFTMGDIEHCVYWNYLLTKLWRHKLWN